ISGILPQITRYIPFDRKKGIDLRKVLSYIEEKQKVISDDQFRTRLAIIGGITASIIRILVLAYIASKHD
ncbi:MAG: hypothetical protein HWN66_18565, partial [Candidatus Helarchaeota archaeon]|nr:hypothetical protein [Candidatus Helarchaeota archaeon]